MPSPHDLQNEEEEAQAQSELHRQKRDYIKKKVKRKAAGATVQASGATMQVAGKATNLAGKGMSTAGNGAKKGGGAIMRAGAGLSSTGIGAIAGIPLAALGGALTLGGAGAQLGGKAVSASGKAVDSAGRAVRKGGKEVSKRGGLRQMKMASLSKSGGGKSSIDKLKGQIPGMNVVPIGKKTAIAILLVSLFITGIPIFISMYVSSLSMWEKFKFLLMLKI